MDVTIIVPIYNRKAVVEQMLKSISDDHRLIIVDNNSSDGTAEYCRNYIMRHNRKNTTLLRERTPGAAAARNKGLSACSTKWVYFFDSDDIFTSLPQTWDESMDLVCMPVCQVEGGKERVRAYKPVSTPHTHILNSMLSTQSMIFRTDFLRQIGGWNNECAIWDDWELGMRALTNTNRVQWIEDKARHRIIIHPDSITGSSFSQRYERIRRTFEIAIDELIDDERLPRDLRKKALFAMYLRCHIYVGKLRHEGDSASADDLRLFTQSKFQVGVLDQRIAKLLEWFTSKGMRGAWKIALELTNHELH